MNWNHHSFVNLVSKLFRESLKTKDDVILKREIASGIWFASVFIKNWITLKDSPKNFPNEYYTKAYELIYDLTWAYFMADSLYNSEKDVLNEIIELEKLNK